MKTKGFGVCNIFNDEGNRMGLLRRHIFHLSVVQRARSLYPFLLDILVFFCPRFGMRASTLVAARLRRGWRHTLRDGRYDDSILIEVLLKLSCWIEDSRPCKAYDVMGDETFSLIYICFT